MDFSGLQQQLEMCGMKKRSQKIISMFLMEIF